MICDPPEGVALACVCGPPMLSVYVDRLFDRLCGRLV